MADTGVRIEAFGDPGCPWDFAAEGARLKLRWLHGDALTWQHRMVGLSRTVNDYPSRGITLEDLAESRRAIAERHGVPIDAAPGTRYQATAVACLAVVAVRDRAPDHVDAFLRALRVSCQSRRKMVDEPATLDAAAAAAGLDADDVRAWTAEPAARDALERDMADAREPDAASRAMPDRLVRTPDGALRLTCPSYRVHGPAGSLSAPGFQPARVYEALVANAAPGLVPRPLPGTADDVMEWAPYPLSTAEVAGVMEVPLPAARAALVRSSARFQPVANDGYWSPG